MKTSSDPREWYRQEELARYGARGGHRRRPSAPANLMPIYVVAGCLAIGVMYLLLLAAGIDIPLTLREFSKSLARP
jgi:hypothetical protein